MEVISNLENRIESARNNEDLGNYHAYVEVEIIHDTGIGVTCEHTVDIYNGPQFEMNIQGLVTPIQLNNSVEFYDYDETMIIEAPM